ncbi:hypothetical protein [Massilia sp. Leaf139]|uniref:hypothetical protein n=1 Tax=Massilia sp. Leaf139 TaxID=1736272 RepID=UPI0006F6785F|nr:hypothetical protein [Massilia sp. Leaf139]KQQ97518.1 hypothetical protein ASF77_06180 [Massilia sp. Leaf139]
MLGPVLGLPAIVTVGQEVTARLGFVDNSARQTHTAVADWGDSCPTPHPLVTEANGRGQVSLRHTFCAPGFQTLVLRVTDSGGRTTETRRQVLINAPGVAALSGRGTLAATQADAKAGRALQFALWAPLGTQGGLGSARAVVALNRPFAFKSEQVGTVSRSGGQVRLDGTGRYNGRPGYRFVVDAVDGGAAPHAHRMRVRISHQDGAGEEVVDYDSGAPLTAKMVAAAAAADGLAAVDGELAMSN